jgi:transposase
VHVSETCEPTTPHLLTQVPTTTATVYEAQCTEPIHQALGAKDLAPQAHFVDGASISAPLLATSRDDHGLTLRGPPRPIQGWHAQTDGAYDRSQFTVAWAQRQARCPQGKVSTGWRE